MSQQEAIILAALIQAHPNWTATELVRVAKEIIQASFEPPRRY